MTRKKRASKMPDNDSQRPGLRNASVAFLIAALVLSAIALHSFDLSISTLT